MSQSVSSWYTCTSVNKASRSISLSVCFHQNAHSDALEWGGENRLEWVPTDHLFIHTFNYSFIHFPLFPYISSQHNIPAFECHPVRQGVTYVLHCSFRNIREPEPGSWGMFSISCGRCGGNVHTVCIDTYTISSYLNMLYAHAQYIKCKHTHTYTVKQRASSLF